MFHDNMCIYAYEMRYYGKCNGSLERWRLKMSKYKLVKGNVWLGDIQDNKTIDCFLVCDDIIVAVGEASDLKKSVPFGASLTEIDAGNNTILPGISDSHIHLLGYSKWQMHVDLSVATSFKNAMELLLEEKNRIPRGAWVYGVNYDETLWPDNNSPTRYDLDEYFQENPVLLDKADGHKHLANTIALKISGVDQIHSPHIPRYENGECSGILNEAAAAPLITMVSKEYETRPKLKQGLKKACHTLSEHGVTSIHDCDVDEFGLGMDLSLYQELMADNDLHVRIQSYHDKMPSFKLTTGYGNDMLYYAGFKIFVDGATTARTAAMSAPYSDDESTSGVLNHSYEELYEMIKNAHLQGIQCQIHAIGDAGITQILDVIEKVTQEYGTPRLPYRINHCIVTDEKLRAKLKQLQVVIDIQPSHVYYLRKSYPIRLGTKRCMENAYCFKSLFETGCLMTGGCDAPSTTSNVNPWFGIWVLCNRTNVDGTNLEHFDPSQVLSLNDALKIFTYNSWAAIGKGHRWGKIAPGYKADFAILDRNIFAEPLSALKDVKNLSTYLNGELVWSR